MSNLPRVNEQLQKNMHNSMLEAIINGFINSKIRSGGIGIQEISSQVDKFIEGYQLSIPDGERRSKKSLELPNDYCSRADLINNLAACHREAGILTLQMIRGTLIVLEIVRRLGES
jgi:hypothetical protein